MAVMDEIYAVRGYSPYMIGDLYTFPDPVPDPLKKQLVDAIIHLKVERTATSGPGTSPPPLGLVRIHFINKEWGDLPKNHVRDALYLTFRPARTYPFHLDLLRNEGSAVARVNQVTGLFRVTTAGWEPIGEGD